MASGDRCLLQRGNRQARVNACVRFAWPDIEPWMRGIGPVPTARFITSFKPGAIERVSLSFTDAAILTTGAWVFCAAAEATSDSYADGRCAGSAVGIVSADRELIQLKPINLPCKAEGVAVEDGILFPNLRGRCERRLPVWSISQLDVGSGLASADQSAELVSRNLPVDLCCRAADVRLDWVPTEAV